MLAAAKLMLNGMKPKPKPPYAALRLTTGATANWRGYISGQIGSLVPNTWYPNPKCTIIRLNHNGSGTVFLEIEGISHIDQSGNWTGVNVNGAIYQRSAGTVTNSTGLVRLSWSASNAFGSAGNIRTVTII